MLFLWASGFLRVLSKSQLMLEHAPLFNIGDRTALKVITLANVTATDAIQSFSINILPAPTLSTYLHKPSACCAFARLAMQRFGSYSLL